MVLRSMRKLGRGHHLADGGGPHSCFAVQLVFLQVDEEDAGDPTQIAALRERFKDDQQKQQQEIMALMREQKVNPVGGCLPVLLQFPIFIALYQVLGNSIELYQAPFMLWIHDLSLKDPFYILPVLMGITMFFQQKLTPNPTMDPAQAKILLYMPLIFTVFMVGLPSGLTLYMWVGAVFSVLQQLYFMRDQSSVTQSAVADAR